MYEFILGIFFSFAVILFLSSQRLQIFLCFECIFAPQQQYFISAPSLYTDVRNGISISRSRHDHQRNSTCFSCRSLCMSGIQDPFLSFSSAGFPVHPSSHSAYFEVQHLPCCTRGISGFISASLDLNIFFRLFFLIPCCFLNRLITTALFPSTVTISFLPS